MNRCRPPYTKFAARADIERLAAIRGPDYLVECAALGRFCPECRGWCYEPNIHAAIRARWSAWDKTHRAETAVRAAGKSAIPQKT